MYVCMFCVCICILCISLLPGLNALLLVCVNHHNWQLRLELLECNIRVDDSFWAPLLVQTSSLCCTVLHGVASHTPLLFTVFLCLCVCLSMCWGMYLCISVCVSWNVCVCQYVSVFEYFERCLGVYVLVLCL